MEFTFVISLVFQTYMYCHLLFIVSLVIIYCVQTSQFFVSVTSDSNRELISTPKFQVCECKRSGRFKTVPLFRITSHICVVHDIPLLKTVSLAVQLQFLTIIVE